MVEILLLLLAYAASTVAFYYGIVSFSYSLLQKTKGLSKWRCTFLLAILNFGFFTLYGMFGLGLILNWAAFLVVFYLECRILLKSSWRLSLFLSLNVCLCALSTTLFYRGMLAIAMDVPLSFFDNASSEASILKLYPVVISYVVCFLIFIYYAKEKNIRQLRHLLNTRSQMRMLTMIMFLLMVLLLLQFFLYRSDQNNLITKIWSLVAGCYMSGGLLFSLKYAIRVSYLFHLDNENTQICKILHEYKSEEEVLRKAAKSDALTGLLCQKEGKENLEGFIRKNIPFCLCIVDLDGLKYINDHMGHPAGDRYLIEVSAILKKNCRHTQDILCRYGGDEFVLGFAYLSQQEASLRMERIKAQIVEKGEQESLPMNISYGIVQWDGQMSYGQLFSKADASMYEMKRLHKEQNPHFVRC